MHPDLSVKSTRSIKRSPRLHGSAFQARLGESCNAYFSMLHSSRKTSSTAITFFVKGAAHRNAPLTKMLFQLGRFCLIYCTLKNCICNFLLGQIPMLWCVSVTLDPTSCTKKRMFLSLIDQGKGSTEKSDFKLIINSDRKSVCLCIAWWGWWESVNNTYNIVFGNSDFNYFKSWFFGQIDTDSTQLETLNNLARRSQVAWFKVVKWWHFVTL